VIGGVGGERLRYVVVRLVDSDGRRTYESGADPDRLVVALGTEDWEIVPILHLPAHVWVWWQREVIAGIEEMAKALDMDYVIDIIDDDN
jgi:hypothetical protein